MPEIIGVMMVKNEERFVGAALRNILDFCDRVIVIDTGSTDKTPFKIMAQQAKASVKIRVFSEPDLSRTHRFVEPYIGTDTWIFGVDGDEIYDPGGLNTYLREYLKRGCGEWSYQLKGCYLHITELGKNNATGYLGPPAHRPTKLYNMANIKAWPSDGKHSLFHPKTRVVDEYSSCDSMNQDWTSAALRCLHMRFLRRSSVDTADEGKRLHPEDHLGFGSRADRGGKDDENERMMYRRGDLVTVDTSAFGELEI